MPEQGTEGMVGRRGVWLIALGLVALAATGSEAQRVEWTVPVGASPSLTPALHPLATDSDGNVFVLGTVGAGATASIVTIKLAPDGTEAWRKTLASTAPVIARAITTDVFGYVLVAASVGSDTGGADYLTVKYDRDGHDVWRQRSPPYLGSFPPVRFASPSAIATDSSGNVYVTGGSNAGADYFFSGAAGDFFTVKYSPSDGFEIWRALTDGGSSLGDSGKAIALDDAGNVYVVGVSFDVFIPIPFGTITSHGLLLKYDSAGTNQWQARLDGGGTRGDGVAVATDAAGNVFMVATATSGFSDLFTLPYLQLGKFDTSGSRLWSVNATPPGATIPGSEASQGHALALDDVGNAYVIGGYLRPGTTTLRTFLTLKYASTGVEQWRAIDSANLVAAENFAMGLVVVAEDKVAVTGQRAASGPGTTLEYGTGGRADWRVEQPTFTPKAIVRGRANSVYVAGATATGIVVQKIVDQPPSAAVATVVPTIGHGALLLLALTIVVLAMRHGGVPSSTVKRR